MLNSSVLTRDFILLIGKRKGDSPLDRASVVVSVYNMPNSFFCIVCGESTTNVL